MPLTKIEGPSLGTVITSSSTHTSNATFSGSRTFFASDSVLDWNSGDVTLTHSANTLTFAGATSGYVFNDGPLTIVKNTTLGASTSGTLFWTAAAAQAAYALLGTAETNTGTGQLLLQGGSGSAAYGGAIALYAHAHATYPGGIWIGRSNGSTGPIMFGTGGTAPGTEQMRLTSGGNLAIGATAKLYLDGVAGTGDTYITESSANKVTVYAGGYANFVFMGVSGGPIFNLSNVGFGVGPTDKIFFDATSASGGGDTYVYERAANSIDFVSGGTNCLRLDAPAGYVNVIGVDLIIPAAKKFYLDGGSDTYIYEPTGNEIRFVAGGTAMASFTYDTLGPTTDNTVYLGWTSTRYKAVYAINGTIQTSDRTLKHDIMDTTLGLNFIQRLRPVAFTMNDEADGTRRHGLIAQDVMEAAEGESLLGILTGDTEGEYGLNYAGFVPALIKAVQQQQEEIAALKAEVAALKG